MNVRALYLCEKSAAPCQILIVREREDLTTNPIYSMADWSPNQIVVAGQVEPVPTTEGPANQAATTASSEAGVPKQGAPLPGTEHPLLNVEQAVLLEIEIHTAVAQDPRI